MLQLDAAGLKARLQRRAPPAFSVYGDDGAGREAAALTAASVLVPVVTHAAGLGVLFTQRTVHLRAHSGQVSFPGGRAEPGDASAEFTALREAEEEVGLARERVEVVARLPDYCTRTGFRVTPVVGGAALAGARSLKHHLDELAPALDVARQLERSAGTRVEGTYEHPSGLHSTYAYAIEVEVDRATGAVRILDCVLVADVGTLINPLAARGQLVGAFAQGLGQALMEEMRLEDGVVTNAGLGDYKMPTMADVPSLRVVLLTDDRGDGPFGAKSVGELANPGVAPAIANAIHDAVGVRVTSLPITAEKVHRALQAPDPWRS